MPHLQRQLETSLAATYSVERELGGGGMSRVFLAEETQLGRKVVIKLLAPEFAEGLSAERFEREIRVAAGLQEPHIVPVIAAGVAAGLPFYTMPFIAGESLRARLSLGALPLREALSILTDVATALEYAHERGIVHRDIKPENILLSKRSAVVTDFGIAKAIADSRPRHDGSTLTAVGTSVGTPPYMAPEQIAADPSIDQRADLYALGIVAYEIFTGSTPFAQRTPTQLIAAIMSEEPQPLALRRPDLPPALTALVTRLLAKDRLARPASAAEILRALDGLAIAGENQNPGVALGQRRLIAGIVAAALLVAAGTYAIRARVDAQSTKDQDDAFWVGGQARTVAVLPFTTTKGDTASENFADGLTDELISALTKVHGLRVTARTSSARFRDKGLSLRTVADSLHVATLVEGTLRRADGRIKATASLVRPSDDKILWSDNVDRQGSDVFAVQEQIAAAIVASLDVGGGGNPRGSFGGRPTHDSVALDLYLAAKRNAATRRREQMDSAVILFRQATARDPRFALAFSALADVYLLGSTGFGTMAFEQALDSAEKAADGAIALDPSLGEAHSSKAFVLMNRSKFASAEAAFQKAFALNPSYALAHHYYSMLLTMERRLDEAERENARTLLLDPFLPGGSAHRGTLLLMRGDYPAARRAFRRTIDVNPGFQVPLCLLGILDAAEGRYAEALPSLQQAYARSPSFPGLRSAIAFTYTKLGQTAKADTMLRELRDHADNDQGRIDRALGEAVMGNIDRAFATLGNPSWDFPSMLNLRVNPLLAKFRDDPRYPTLLKRMGLKP